MAIDVTFLQSAGENALGAAAAGAFAVLASGEFHLIGDVPWYAIASAGAISGLASLLKSLISLKAVHNGTASFLPSVVANVHTNTAPGSE